MTTPEDPPFGLRWNKPIANEAAKARIAEAVAARARPGETIGAGSGSTSFLTVVALGRRAAAEGFDVSIVPTSFEIQWAGEAVGLRVCGVVPDRVDWCFDGADEVDPAGRLIKGRGGALYRERLVFAAAERRLVVADASKDVERLGSRFPVPVEVEPAWARRAHAVITRMPHVRSADLRFAQAKDGPVVTELGCVLLDVWFDEIDAEDEGRLLAVPGVRGTGIFAGYAYERYAGAGEAA